MKGNTKITQYGAYEGYSLELEECPLRVRNKRLLVYRGSELIGKTSWCIHHWAFMCRARQIVHLDKRKRGEA